ncbi:MULTISPECIES: D-Ala-D-Ala carboxypeptidase family metallohydrolase [unclassified Halomonas]|uniref:D-Ala-D-Ala carboxypeptidase family metallohydrolase n=1 Tax=unclassified Halomonas TaxID=2609666 RepID=UPI00099085B0|nr:MULTISPECIES: D-Ala-D-Ala carboxypeptidase family metallohydrolase [unclassified Halomonas]AQU83234.1 serine/threonine protein kinase [Halomonas sp. 'Soap Lake \
MPRDDLSTHFRRREFACKCGCGFDTVDLETLALLQDIRIHFNVPVVITSGCRCAAHNRRVGGAANSQHVFGRAADIRVQGISPAAVADYVEAHHPTASVGRYGSFTHVDTRTSGPARWRG